MKYFKFCRPAVNVGDVVLVLDGKKIVLLERCDSICSVTSKLVDFYKNHPEYICYIFPSSVFISFMEEIFR